jgi:WD40 repeat protein
LNVLTFSPDSRFVIIASRFGPGCQVRELPAGRLVQERSLGSAGSLAVAVRPSEGSFVTIDSPGNVREWDLPSARPVSLDAGRVLEQAGDVALAAGGRELLALKAGDDPDPGVHFAVHDVATGAVLRQFVRRGPGNYESSSHERPFEVSAQGSRLVLVLFKPNREDVDHLEVWDHTSGQRLLSLDGDALGGGLPPPFPAFPSYNSRALDAAGTRLAVRIQRLESRPDGERPVVRGSAVSVVALPSGRLIRSIPDPAGGAQGLMLSPDGRLLALARSQVMASGDRRARIDLLEPDSGHLVRSLHSRLSSVGAIAFSSDGRRLAACERLSYGGLIRSAIQAPASVDVWDLSAGAAPEPVHLDGHSQYLAGLAFSADGRRLATVAMRNTFTECELKLWDLASGRDLVTWSLAGGRPLGLAFDPDGRRLRVLGTANRQTSDARVVLFDAAPLAPAVEALDLVDRLAQDAPLNSELAANVEAEPGLDPAVRAAALEVIALRPENCTSLMGRASSWLGVGAAERTPELMRRALTYAERAAALVADLNAAHLATLGEARYRNGRLAECLEPLRQSLALQEQDNLPVERRQYRALALIAMAEAKLGHRELAQAALDEYRSRLVRASGGAMAKPSEDTLLAEAEGVLREAFQGGGGSETDRRGVEAGRGSDLPLPR